ncbi:unnamed protein product [Cylicocyclus nassatus]|uniref:Uncharacterized protein n=1 Tax=Cylicocyclus nassatus TaxID=53992 RepID=A0AA36DQC1_CYLNA|nr:unnamed protein product [Cylicocyclus nassatus]
MVLTPKCWRHSEITDFLLDALDLGHYDLQGYRLDALRNSRDSFWLSLGESDEERDKKFNSLLEQKSYWLVKLESAFPRRSKT